MDHNIFYLCLGFQKIVFGEEGEKKNPISSENEFLKEKDASKFFAYFKFYCEFKKKKFFFYQTAIAFFFFHYEHLL